MQRRRKQIRKRHNETKNMNNVRNEEDDKEMNKKIL